MTLDKLSPSELLEYHKYRKKLRHLYVCTDCAKGFDRERPVSKCIFCSGVIKELERDDIPTAKPLKISTRELLSMRKKQIKEKIRFIGARSLGLAARPKFKKL